MTKEQETIGKMKPGRDCDAVRDAIVESRDLAPGMSR